MCLSADTITKYILPLVLLIIINVNGQLQQQQYFKTRPQPSVEVVEGGSVILQCAIGNQRGPVQWAKDGFVLGYDRNIPGYPRFSMAGDESAGVHNLRISNAKSDDNGEYQCQVGPGAGNNLPIRATSKLTVLIPPSSIEIVGHSNSTQLEIREGQTLNLECVVNGGKPSALIKWYRKNVELRTDNVSVKEISSPATHHDTSGDSIGHGGQQSSASSSSVTKSTITITPHAEDNGVSYTCEAVHSALSAPMRHSLTLSVLYPPGPPEISGYIEGETVRMGDTITLVCRSVGGNPLAQLVWYKNDEQVDFSYTTTSNRQSSNSHTFVVDSSDNNAIYRCVGSSSITLAPMVAEVKLQVHFAPSKVTISGVKDAKSGDTVTMSCRTERSNPPSEISWVVDGRPITASNTIVADPTGGWITSANVTVAITNQDRNMKMLSCYAINQALGETIVETSVLNILYPPDTPSIFGYTEGNSIRAGTLQRMTCVCQGGNPLCQLKWLKGDQEVTLGTQTNTNGNVVSSEIAIVTKDSDNGAEYKCQASNSATIEPLMATIQLTVHFPPSGVYIKVNPRQPKSGSQVELVCETGSSNPQSVVTWWRDGFLLNGHQDGIIDGLYGGKITRNILRLNVTSDDDGAVLTCQATNRVLQQSVHDATTLSIQYAPEFINSPLTQFDLIEGQSASINLTARGNPSHIKYKWSRDTGNSGVNDGQPLDVTRFRSDGPMLNISSVIRGDAGIYKLYATNELGTSETAIRVNVHYSATIRKVTELVMADEGGNAYLECGVDANPISESTITWRRRRNETDTATLPLDPTRTRQMVESLEPLSPSSSAGSSSSSQSSSQSSEMRLKSTLVIYNATLEDSGASFDCVASNGIGDTDTSTATLLVLHKPIIDRSPLLSKSAGDNGSTGRLVCRARAAPNCTFTWTREGSVLPATLSVSGSGKSSLKYIIEPTTQLDLVTYQSVLTVTAITSADYGAYQCVARNDLGFDGLTITLSRTSRPDAPLALRVINITSAAVVLKWIPGFDGGIGQDFRVRYRPTVSGADPSYSYRDVFPANATTLAITGLAENTEYIFGVMAHNEKGHSDYTADIVKATTLKESPVTETEKIISKVIAEHAGDIPRLIIIVSLVGSSLLLFNIVLVVCFVRKRRRKRYEEVLERLCKLCRKSDYSGGTDSKTTASSKTTIEMYQGSNSASYNKGVTETSLSEEDEENKSQGAYSGHTDYEMEISPSGVVTTHHHGISTYLIDDAIAPSQHYPPSRYTNLVNPIGPDVTTNAYFIDRQSDDYVSALRKNAYNQQLATSAAQDSGSSVGPSPVPSMHQLTVSLSPSNHVSYLNAGSGDHHLLETASQHSQHHSPRGNYGQQQSPHSQLLLSPSMAVPPLPPLRSIGNNNMSTFLPMISEEPPITPIGHLV